MNQSCARRSIAVWSLVLLAATALHAADATPPEPFGTLPSDVHLAWHELE